MPGAAPLHRACGSQPGSALWGNAQYPPYPARISLTSLQGRWGNGAMKAVLLAVAVVLTATVARAEDMAEMISRYRHSRGLSTVKIDPQLTAIAERQAK